MILGNFIVAFGYEKKWPWEGMRCFIPFSLKNRPAAATV